MQRLAAFGSILLFAAVACGPPPVSGGGGTRTRSDAGAQPVADAGDAATRDAGAQGTRDAGAPPADAGQAPVDAGQPPQAGACLEQGNGRTTGSKMANLRLQNCNGDWVELHDNCGRTKVQVVMLVTEWCPHCQPSMTEFSGLSDRFEQDWENIFVLGELGRNVPATMSECGRVARAKGVDPNLMVIDPGFARTLQGGWVRPCTQNGSFGLPQINIMDGESMTLRWESMCDGRIGEVDPNPILQELLSR